MEGAHSGPSRGIIPRAIEDVFMYIENDRNAAQSKFLVRASYLQIYNEVSQGDFVVQCAHLSLQPHKRKACKHNLQASSCQRYCQLLWLSLQLPLPVSLNALQSDGQQVAKTIRQQCMSGPHA